MGKESEADESKLPYWNDLDMEGFRVDSHIHDLPYDSGILLENLMDPAHIPISHDKSAHPPSYPTCCQLKPGVIDCRSVFVEMLF